MEEELEVDTIVKKEAELNAVGAVEPVALAHLDSRIIDLTATGLVSFASKLGFSGALGVCAGYAFKQAAKVAITVVGVVFVGLQGLHYVGYIKINWKKIKDDCLWLMDTDGSGKLGVKDVKYYLRGVVSVLSYGGAGATGLATGIYFGVRHV